MKNLCTILFLFVALASRATDVSFDFKNLAGGADYFRLSTSTNRLKITPLEAPFIWSGQLIGADPVYFLPSTNGTGTMTNLAPSRYLATIRIKEKETSFQFVVTNSASTVPLYGLTSVTTNSNPETGSSYSISTQNAVFVAKNGTPTNTQVLTYNAELGGYYPSNSAAGGPQTNAFPTTAATVATGSTNSFVAGGNSNRLSGAFAVIVGGTGNTNSANYGFIGGGIRNTNIAGSTQGSAIVGGYDNLNMSWQGFIGAGNNNKINPAEFATIVGGSQNTILSGQASVICAGQDGVIASEWSSILGGNTNSIWDGTDYASIVGGVRNRIGEPGGVQAGSYAFIGGGESNVVHDDYAAIMAGKANVIDGGGNYSAILGGRDNSISAASDSFIVGHGLTNTLANSVDIGGSDATKASISLTGSVFRTAVTAPSVTVSAGSVTGTNFVATGVTASRAAAFNSLKELISSSVTDTEQGFLSGVTAGIQAQFANGSNNVSGLRTPYAVTSNDVVNLKALLQIFLPGANLTFTTNNGTNVTAALSSTISNVIITNSSGVTVTGTVAAVSFVGSSVSLTNTASPGAVAIQTTNGNPININGAPQALSYTGSGAAGTNVSVNATNGHVFTLLMTNNVFLTAANLAVGQELGVILIQGGIGDYKLSFNTNILRTNDVDGYTIKTNVGGQSFVSIVPGYYGTNAATGVRKMY